MKTIIPAVGNIRVYVILLFLLFPGVILAKIEPGFEFTLVSSGLPVIPFEGTCQVYWDDNLFHATCSILEWATNLRDWKLGMSVLRRFEMGLWYDVPFKGFLFPLVIERRFRSFKNFDIYIHVELPIVGIYENRKGQSMDNAIFFSTGIRKKFFWTRAGIGTRVMYLLFPSTQKDYLHGRWWISIDLTYDIGIFKIHKEGK